MRECSWSPEPGKGRTKDPPLEPPEGRLTMLTLRVAQEAHVGLLNYRTVRE